MWISTLPTIQPADFTGFLEASFGSEIFSWWHFNPTIVKPQPGDLLGGGFKYFLFSPRTLGKIPNLTHMFQRGWNHQLVYIGFLEKGVSPVVFFHKENPPKPSLRPPGSSFG